MKLLVLSPFVYYPGVPHGGGALCWGQLEGLSRSHEIHFVSFAKEDSAEYRVALPHLQRLCATVTCIPQQLSRLQIIWAQLLLLFKQVPIGASLFNSNAMVAALRKIIQMEKPDAVLIQFPQMAQYVDHCLAIPTVMDVQDAFSVSAYRLFKSQIGFGKKAVNYLNWLAWISYESRCYSQFSATMALTHQDQIGLEIFSPGLSAVTSPAAVQIPSRQWSPGASQTIAYIGSFAHPPNLSALLFFIHDILPVILKDAPEAVFVIAGKGVPAAVSALAGPNIRFVGVVPDAFEFVCSASVVVIPLKSGGGVKIKTLEAMACGCPIVSTSIGAEEIGAVSGKHMLIADSAPEFAQAVLALLKTPVLSADLGAKARALVEEKFSWSAKWASLNSILQQATTLEPIHNHNKALQIER